MGLRRRLAIAVLLLLAGCASPAGPSATRLPAVPVTGAAASAAAERPEPLPAGVKPLTVEQDEEIGQ